VASEKIIRTSGFYWWIGRKSLWLRDKWFLTGIVGLAAIALATLPRLAVDQTGKLLGWALIALTVLGVAAAVAVFLDKVADKHGKRVDELVALGEQSAGGRAMSGVLALLDEIHDASFVSNQLRKDRLKTMRVSAAAIAAGMTTADNVRATYYALSRDDSGWRELKDPKSRGRGTRQDQADSEYFESRDPAHAIWKVMDGRDTACEIVSSPDQKPGVDWDSKPYKTFISVPVKVDGVQFGLLSLNAPVVGDLTELDRLSLIALARTMGAVLALDKGHSTMRVLRDTLGSVAQAGYPESHTDPSTDGTREETQQ
jgi:hypothetical protein